MTTSFTQFKKKALADRKVRSEYEALSVQHDITQFAVRQSTISWKYARLLDTKSVLGAPLVRIAIVRK
jgi:hypothetical protein